MRFGICSNHKSDVHAVLAGYNLARSEVYLPDLSYLLIGSVIFLYACVQLRREFCPVPWI